MNSIVNIEDRLHIVKQLIELQIKVGAQFDYIILTTEYQKWEQNDFRAECLGANLNDLKQLKILENILSLSDEIMNLFLNLPKNVPYLNRTTTYTFEGIPYGAKFSDFLLTKKEEGKRYNFVTQENTFSVLKKGTWEDKWYLMKEEHWKDCSIFEIMGENRTERMKDKKIYSNMYFFEFVKSINLFLKDYVFIEKRCVNEHVFSDYLNSENKETLIKKIETLVNEEKGKRIAHVLIFLQEKELINMPKIRKDIYNLMKHP